MVRFYDFIKKHRYRLTATFLLLTAIIIMLTVRLTSQVNDIRGGLLDVVASVQKVIRSPVDAMREAQAHIEALYRLYEDNQNLRAELARMRPEKARIEELTKENVRLRSLLKMPLETSYNALVAPVIGDSSTAFARSFVIGIGSDMGVKVDNPVVYKHAVVGRVVQTGRRSSLVLALLDHNSRVPILVQRSRVRALAVGTNEKSIDLQFVAKDADIMVGDYIITSGIGGVFPKGLTIGRVVSVDPFGSGLFQKVAIQPSVDFDRLEEVRILRDVPNEEPS